MPDRNHFGRPGTGDAAPCPSARPLLEPLESRLLLDGQQWTVMVYLGGDGDLEYCAIEDFLEMARVGSDEQINVVTLLDRTPEQDYDLGYDTRYDDWADARQGIVYRDDVPDTNWGESIGEVNTGDPATLAAFVNWAQTTAPAEHYALILWGHGEGYPGVCIDESEDAGEDEWESLTPAELDSALSDLAQPLDLIGFDACLMCMVEVAYEIRDRAAVMVGSQETEAGQGWSYARILGDLAEHPDWTPTDFGADIVQRFREDYGTDESYDCLSSIDLSKVGDLAAAVGSLADAIIHQSTGADIALLRIHWDNTPYFGGWYRSDCYYNDLGQFLDLVAHDAEINAAMRSAAQAALDVHNEAILSHFAGEWAFSTGISIYYPEHGAEPNADYNGGELLFAADTVWDEYLHWWYDRTIPAPAIEVLGAGRTIRNGDLTPGTVDGTDFGYVSLGSGQKSRDYTIRNNGTSTLHLTGAGPVEILGPGADDFTVTVQAADAVDAGAFTTFRISFAPGTAGVRNATVRIANDDLGENPFTFAVRGTGQAPSLSISDAAVVEGDAGTTDAVFTVTISEDPFAAVEVSYATQDGTAEAGADYQPVAGRLTFQPGGPRTLTIAVPVLGDVDPEGDEAFFVTLSDPTNAGISRAKATGTVQDDDGLVLPFGGRERAVFNEPDGDQVTVAMGGPGQGSVLLDADGSIREIRAEGTTDRSSLSINVRKASGGDGIAPVGGIVVEGSIKSIAGKAVRLGGDLRVGGILSSLVLDDVDGGHEIALNTDGLAPGPRDGVSMTFDRVADTSVATNGLPIRSLTATEWLNGDGTAVEQIVAPSMGKLTIKGDRRGGRDGDFQAALVLDGSDGAKLTLGGARIAGGLRDAVWDISGAVGAVAISGTTPDWTLHSSTDGLSSVKSLTLGLAGHVVIDVNGQLGTVRAAAWGSGEITADGLKSLNIPGDRRASLDGSFWANLTLRGDPAAKLTLGSARIAGSVESTVWDISGAVGAVTVAGVVSSWTLHSAADQLSSVKSLTLGEAWASVEVHVDGDLGAVRAAAWGGGAVAASTLKSLSISGNRHAGVEGDFGADVTLGGSPTAKQTLGGARIAGSIDGGTWQIDGDAGSIVVSGNAANWTLQGSGAQGAGLRSVKSLALGEASDCDVTVEDVLKSVKAVRWTGGGLQADQIGSLQITGNGRAGVEGSFAAAVTVRGANVPARRAAIGSVRIANDLHDSIWQVGGDLGRVQVGGCVRDSSICAVGSIAGMTLGAAEGSDFFAGVDPAALQPGDRHADGTGDFTNPDAKIGSMKISGWRVAKGEQPPRFLIDSNFSAPSFGAVSLLNASGGPAYGLYVLGDETHIRSVSHRDTLEPQYNWSWRPGQPWLVVGSSVTLEVI